MRAPSLIRAIPISRLVASSLLALTLTAQANASTESELNARWRGAWAIIGVDAISGCAGNYTNNEVRGRRVSGKGDHRFSAGELATVYKINLKRKQVEVLLDLVEPLVVPYREGPFTLYDELACKVELQIKLPRSVNSGSAGQVDSLIAEILERHEDAASAESSPGWNRRLREPLPDNCDETLYEYERWRAEQVNAAVAARIEDSVEEAARLVDRLDDDPDYLDGFAAGVDRARDRSFDKNCERLLSMSLSSFVHSGSRDDGREFNDGYRDGQKLVFYLETARRLKACFLPPPL
ncbi:MAG: hypothetical protein GY769_18195 [bacterium]|nr:hypothetical protein [bacterium]